MPVAYARWSVPLGAEPACSSPHLSATPKVDLGCCGTACPVHHHAHVPADAYDEVHSCHPSCCPTPAASLRSSAPQGARPAQQLRGFRRLGGTDARAAAAMAISGSSSLTSVCGHVLCATTHHATAQAVASGSGFLLHSFDARPAALLNAHHLCCESNVPRGEILLTQQGREIEEQEQQGPTMMTLPLLRNQRGSKCCSTFCRPSVNVSIASARR